MEGLTVPATAAPREIRFICTDGGQHPSREVGVVRRLSDDDPTIYLPTDRMSFVQARESRSRSRTVEPRGMHTTEGRGVELSDVMWHLKCPTCRLHIEWKDDRAVEIIDKLLATFGCGPACPVVDLSALPATLR